MTHPELMNERRVIYETRLGIKGYGPADIPNAADHNEAVAEADAHIEALMDEKQKQAKRAFEDMRQSL